MIPNLPFKRDPPKEYVIIGAVEDGELIKEYKNTGWNDQLVSAEYILDGLLRYEFNKDKYRLKKIKK
jgi:hypothetical protein